jgi:hypothetical protein
VPNAIGRIFLNDSLYEGMITGQVAHGFGRLTYLDGSEVKKVSGFWNNGQSSAILGEKSYTSKRKIEYIIFSPL